jgi:hypothetical protein
VNTRIHRQFRVQNAALDAKLLKIEFQAITSVDISNKYDAFPLDEFEFEYDVYQQKFLIFGTSEFRLANLLRAAFGCQHT